MRLDGADVIIIGGGLAGGCAAHALAVRGAQVTILEALPGLCERASGNRHGLITPYITSRTSPLETVYSTGFEYTSKFLHDVLSKTVVNEEIFDQCGALHLPATPRLAHLLADSTPFLGSARIQRVSQSAASELAGIPLNSDAFYIPDAGFVSPAQVIHTLLALHHDRIRTRTSTRAVEITRPASHWRVHLSDQSYCDASIVIICGAFESSQLNVSSWLPLEPIRGQTIAVKASPLSSPLKTLLCFGGYLVPARDNIHLMGAHYRHHDPEEHIKEADSSDILKAGALWMPAIPFSLSDIREARVCFRTSTVDRLPYIGGLPDFASMEREAAEFQPGTNLLVKVPNRLYEGLYVHAGHGSRGLLSCPMGGEIIARLICKEPLGELAPVSQACCPGRLPHRLLKASRER